MARITVEDSLQVISNRFALTLLAARRSRQLLEGATPLIKTDNKLIVTALREIAAAKVTYDNYDEVCKDSVKGNEFQKNPLGDK